MKKSNWLITGVLVLASIIFLIMWFALGFNVIDNPLDLVVTIIWWAVIILVCALIAWAENKRRRSIRTSFLAPGVIYNPEMGVVKVKEDQSYVQALQQLLNSLDYGSTKNGTANDKRIKFKYIVRSNKFANNGSTWIGEVVKISSPDDIRSFNSRRELSKLVDGE